jgi:hypothetical protein
MTDNEKLIEEARTFASSAPLGKTVWRELDKAILLIRRMSDALEAAEKALTPTDDEREALLAGYLDQHGHHADARHGFLAGLAAGLRRTEVPEPSAEDDLNAEYDARLGDGDRDDPEPQGEPSDAQTERARIIADLREWSRPLGNSPEEETLRLVIDRIERAAGNVR